MVNQLEVPCSSFSSPLIIIEAVLQFHFFILMVCKFYLLYFILCIRRISICFILAMLIYNFVVKSFEIILENLYSLSAISEKNWDVKSTRFRWNDNSFLWKSEQLMSPDIAGINSVLTISPSCFSWLLIYGIVRIKYVGLCSNPVIKHEYAACDSYHTILR